MLYKVSDEPCTLLIPLLVDGEYVTPDVGTVTYTVRGNDGTITAGLSAVAIVTDSTTTEVSITILAANNTKAAGKDFENRTVLVDFQVGGAPHQARLGYRITDWLNFTVSESDVRGLIGVSFEELPNEDVDLISAYFSVRTTLGEAVLLTALEAGDDTTEAANMAIACVAAQGVIPSLQLRAVQSEGDGVNKFTRFSSIDWGDISSSISAKLSRAVSTITGISESTPTFGLMNVPTDAITGT